MSGDMNDSPEASPDGAQISMAYYAALVLGAATSLTIAGLLFATFWLGRPQNLSQRTTELADLIEVALVDHYIPPENINREDGVPQSHQEEKTTVRWTSHIFNVALPKQLNGEGLRKLLRDEVSTYYVRMTSMERSPDAPDVERLAFYLDKQLFAEVRLLPTPNEQVASYQSDLRSSSVQLADLAESVLKLLTPTAASTREPPVAREDLNSLWYYTHLTAELSPGLTLGALKERLEAVIALPDARVETGLAAQSGANLQISLGGRPCVGLTCSVTPAVAPARPTPVSLEGVLEGGILGSEPSEEPEAAAPPKAMAVEPLAPEGPKESASPAETVSVVESPSPPPVRKSRTRMAIIIDDGGYVRADTDRVLNLDTRLTLAILPNTPHGKDTAREGAAAGFEIMLHMPMETHSATEQAVEGTLFTAMGKKEIQKLTRDALDQYPEVVGVNNHTGSKFTENAEKLNFVFDVLKERDLYFIDSYTKSTSVALDTAARKGLFTARRDVFLDNEEDTNSIRTQFERLVKEAIEKGSAIGIGHFQKPNTAKVLAEELPKLKNAGIDLVHASELVQ
jgi:uncharacterized protein